MLQTSKYSRINWEGKWKSCGSINVINWKRDKSIKGRCAYNGKPTRDWLTKEETRSPTVSLKSVMLTAVVDSHEDRDVMTSNVPNAFIQTHVPEIKKEMIKLLWKLQECLWIC